MKAVTVFVCCLCLIAFTEVASWTVDLDEVRQFLDNEKAQEDYQQLHYHNYYDESEEYDGFGEVRQGHRGQNYAHQYGYEGYMEKKVHGYIYKGAQYLDGLRLALENYKQLMENCSVYNFTEFDNLNTSLLPDVRWNETADAWNWNWAQGETNVQWPQILNINQNTTQSATVSPTQVATPGTPLGAPVDATPGAPPGAPLGVPRVASLGGPPDSALGGTPGVQLGGTPGAPPGAPLGRSSGALPAAPFNAPPGAPLSGLPGAPPGFPVGAPLGSLVGAPPGSPIGVPPGSPVGAPPGSPKGAQPGSSLGGSPDEQPGIPLGTTLGAPLGSPPGDTLDVAPNDPLGVPPDAMLNLRHVATQRSTHFLPESFSREQTQRAKCQKATREREHVRRLADLALFTARQLQNWANQEMHYEKSSMHAKEERELIMRLAYFLDKLAELTGYTPEIKVFNKSDTTTTTTTANPMPAMSEQLRQLLLSCLRQQTASPEASAPSERCPARQLLPPLLMRIFNITEDNITTVATTTATPPLRSSALTTTPSPIHIDPELRQARVLDNYFLSNLWAQQPMRTKRKRSVNDPLMKMVQYYTKHKAWTGANEFKIDNEELNVQNHLMKTKSMEDRSDYFKSILNLSFLNPYKNNRGFRRPKNPIIKYEDKLNKYLERLRKNEASSSNIVRKFNVLPRKFNSKIKRSIVIQEPEDPMKDISYYVKNKPGTNVRPSLVDAVRVRASLERIFNTGNIEVVRRYGANYNPLIPSPFYFGIIKTISDI